MWCFSRRYCVLLILILNFGRKIPLYKKKHFSYLHKHIFIQKAEREIESEIERKRERDLPFTITVFKMANIMTAVRCVNASQVPVRVLFIPVMFSGILFSLIQSSLLLCLFMGTDFASTCHDIYI